ncbi:hypothetical protein [Enterococcus casseliflavus]
MSKKKPVLASLIKFSIVPSIVGAVILVAVVSFFFGRRA